MAAAEVYQRGVGVVALCAFASTWCQWPALYGAHGLEPVDDAWPALGASEPDWTRLPSLLHLGPWLGLAPSLLCEAILVCGMALAAALATLRMPGVAAAGIIAALFALYLSVFLAAGAPFLSFQWDTLLLEALAASALAVDWLPPGVGSRSTRLRFFGPGRHLARFALFKLMLMAGAVKVQSGCPTWLGLTATSVHFASQCIPSPAAWWLHQLPPIAHKFVTALTLWAELPVPLLLLSPLPRLATAGAAIQIALQLLIIISGNYTFFNLLTCVLCVAALPPSPQPTEEAVASPPSPAAVASDAGSLERGKASSSSGRAARNAGLDAAAAESEAALLRGDGPAAEPAMAPPPPLPAAQPLPTATAAPPSQALRNAAWRSRLVASIETWLLLPAFVAITAGSMFELRATGSADSPWWDRLDLVLRDEVAGVAALNAWLDAGLLPIVAWAAASLGATALLALIDELHGVAIAVGQNHGGSNMLAAVRQRSQIAAVTIARITARLVAIAAVIAVFAASAVSLLSLRPALLAVPRHSAASSHLSVLSATLSARVIPAALSTYHTLQPWHVASGYGLFRRMTGVGPVQHDAWGAPITTTARPEWTLQGLWLPADLNVTAAQVQAHGAVSLSHQAHAAVAAAVASSHGEHRHHPQSHGHGRQSSLPATAAWIDIPFPYKPGDVARAPPHVAPHQPRLDWQMWFAALGDFQRPWFLRLLDGIVSGNPATYALLDVADFPVKRLLRQAHGGMVEALVPPVAVRGVLHEYDFTRLEAVPWGIPAAGWPDYDAAPSVAAGGQAWWRRRPASTEGATAQLPVLTAGHAVFQQLPARALILAANGTTAHRGAAWWSTCTSQSAHLACAPPPPPPPPSPFVLDHAAADESPGLEADGDSRPRPPPDFPPLPAGGGRGAQAARDLQVLLRGIGARWSRLRTWLAAPATHQAVGRWIGSALQAVVMATRRLFTTWSPQSAAIIPRQVIGGRDASASAIDVPARQLRDAGLDPRQVPLPPLVAVASAHMVVGPLQLVAAAWLIAAAAACRKRGCGDGRR